jgi:hypothetical protein
VARTVLATDFDRTCMNADGLEGITPSIICDGSAPLVVLTNASGEGFTERPRELNCLMGQGCLLTRLAGSASA